jgi:RHS repeat-associated protein
MLIGKDHYYPFGMVLGGQSWQNTLQNTKNDYLYNGKEFQDELGLDWYDYGARFYDAALGRFFTPDPLGQFASGYVYCGNNPIALIDPSGMWASACDSEKMGWLTDEEMGDHKKNNIFLLLQLSDREYQAAINEACNANGNWTLIFADDIISGGQAVSDYLGDSQTDYIAIHYHGFEGEILIPYRNEDGSLEDINLVQKIVIDYNNSNKDWYAEHRPKQYNLTFNSLKQIGSHVRGGENSGLIFTACHAGLGEGEWLGKQLQTLFGNRFDIYLNTNASQSKRWYLDNKGKPIHVIFDVPLSHNGEPGNYIIINPLGKRIQLDGTLQFNSTGKPISVVPLSNPGAIKKPVKYTINDL